MAGAEGVRFRQIRPAPLALRPEDEGQRRLYTQVPGLGPVAWDRAGVERGVLVGDAQVDPLSRPVELKLISSRCIMASARWVPLCTRRTSSSRRCWVPAPMLRFPSGWTLRPPPRLATTHVALAQVRLRLAELIDDPEPVMQQHVRVFIDDGTYCPGFQVLAGGQLHPAVMDLFSRAMELKIPHNYFTVWMITSSRDLGGARPVDVLKDSRAPLPWRRALEALARSVGAHYVPACGPL